MFKKEVKEETVSLSFFHEELKKRDDKLKVLEDENHELRNQVVSLESKCHVRDICLDKQFLFIRNEFRNIRLEMENYKSYPLENIDRGVYL